MAEALILLCLKSLVWVLEIFKNCISLRHLAILLNRPKPEACWSSRDYGKYEELNLKRWPTVTGIRTQVLRVNPCACTADLSLYLQAAIPSML